MLCKGYRQGLRQARRRIRPPCPGQETGAVAMSGGLMKRALIAGSIALGLMAAGGPATAADAVRVGSKIDTEGRLLGSMILELLEANGIAAENRTDRKRVG